MHDKKKHRTFASVLKTASRGGAVVARWAHNPKAGGSIPSPATKRRANLLSVFFLFAEILFFGQGRNSGSPAKSGGLRKKFSQSKEEKLDIRNSS